MGRDIRRRPRALAAGITAPKAGKATDQPGTMLNGKTLKNFVDVLEELGLYCDRNLVPEFITTNGLS